MPDKDERTREPVEPATPDVLANPETRREWSEEDVARLREALTAADDAEAAARVDVSESLPPEAEVEIEVVEAEYQEALDGRRLEIAKDRLRLLTGILGRVQSGMEAVFGTVPGTRRVAEFVDLHTIEHVMEFAMELVPFVGATYAVTGYRLDVRKHPDATRSLDLQKLSKWERGIYAFGELLVSGHLIRGATKAVFKMGAKKAVKVGAKILMTEGPKRVGANLTRRVEKGVERTKQDVVKKITGR